MPRDNKLRGERVWLNFWVSEETKDWIRQRAADERVSMSQVVREIVERARARSRK